MLCDIEPGPIEDLNYRGQHRRGIERFVDAVLNDRPALVEPQPGPRRKPELRAGGAGSGRSGGIGCSHLARQGSIGLGWMEGGRVR